MTSGFFLSRIQKKSSESFVPWTSVVRGTFFATGGAGGGAAALSFVCAMVNMLVEISAASTSAGRVSLFIFESLRLYLRRLSFRRERPRTGRAANYKEPAGGRQ